MIAGGARAARRWLACAALPYLLSARLARENSGQGAGQPVHRGADPRGERTHNGRLYFILRVYYTAFLAKRS